MADFKVGDKVIGVTEHFTYHGIVRHKLKQGDTHKLTIDRTWRSDKCTHLHMLWYCHKKPDGSWGADCLRGTLTHMFKQDKIIELKRKLVGE